MKRVAFVCPEAILPAYSGNKRRMLSLINNVRALGCEADIIILPSLLRDVPDIELHKNEFGAENVFFIPRRMLGDVRHMAKRFLMECWRKLARKFRIKSAYYLMLDEYFYEAARSDINKILINRHYDIVVVNYVAFSRIFHFIRYGTKRVIDTHDIFQDRHTIFDTDVARRAYWYSVSKDTEDRGWRRADAVIAIHDNDAKIMSQRLAGSRTEVHRIGQIVDLSKRVDDFSKTAVSFLGSSALANILAMKFFIEEVIPRILARTPDFKLFLAGEICMAAAGHPNVFKLGHVGHVRELFERAPLFINPILQGTGINIKLLDAMACGIGVVSTETGARGLGRRFSAGVIAVPDNDADLFAQLVAGLMEDEDRRRHLGSEAYAAMVEWNQIQKEALQKLFLE